MILRLSKSLENVRLYIYNPLELHPQAWFSSGCILEYICRYGEDSI